MLPPAGRTQPARTPAYPAPKLPREFVKYPTSALQIEHFCGFLGLCGQSERVGADAFRLCLAALSVLECGTVRAGPAALVSGRSDLMVWIGGAATGVRRVRCGASTVRVRDPSAYHASMMALATQPRPTRRRAA